MNSLNEARTKRRLSSPQPEKFVDGVPANGLHSTLCGPHCGGKANAAQPRTSPPPSSQLWDDDRFAMNSLRQASQGRFVRRLFGAAPKPGALVRALLQLPAQSRQRQSF